MKANIILAVVLILLVGCEQSSGLPSDFDRSGETMHVTVVYHDDAESVREKYEEDFGVRKEGQDGYAVWKNPGAQPYTCEIHVVRPRYDGDTAMDALGHEMTHCLIGSFHKE